MAGGQSHLSAEKKYNTRDAPTWKVSIGYNARCNIPWLQSWLLMYPQSVGIIQIESCNSFLFKSSTNHEPIWWELILFMLDGRAKISLISLIGWTCLSTSPNKRTLYMHSENAKHSLNGTRAKHTKLDQCNYIKTYNAWNSSLKWIYRQNVFLFLCRIGKYGHPFQVFFSDCVPNWEDHVL